MKEQAQQVLADMLQRALNGVDAAVEFSQAQIPDVVEQLLMWHMVESFLFFFTGILLVVAAIICVCKLRKAWGDFCDAVEPEGAAVVIAMLAVLPAGGLLMIYCNLDWLKILIAPKLYILEYAASLVK